MYSLLVLGIVPGTNIQITFTTWLQLALLATAIWIVKNRLDVLVSLQSLADQHTNSQASRGLHATQIHRRG